MKGFSMGPDGKRHELEFGGGENTDLEELLRSKIREALESSDQSRGERSSDGKPKIELKLGDGKGTWKKHGSSGDRDSKGEKSKNFGGVRIEGFSIGPDGKKRELNLGDGKGIQLERMMRSRLVKPEGQKPEKTEIGELRDEVRALRALVEEMLEEKGR